VEQRDGRISPCRIVELGAWPTADGRVRFKVWAPFARTVTVEVAGPGAARLFRLRRDRFGYFRGLSPNVRVGDRYFYRLDGERRFPDPASRFQPLGVHGPSEIIDPLAFRWTDGTWAGLPLERYVVYEIHVGTFSERGDFRSVALRLGYLRELGVTAVELMPVAQFPGARDWGYDGAFPFAPQNSYGGPLGLKRLINACHKAGLAVVLDVVYNHLGPEGNYLGHFGPYFTKRYPTPWGDAVNFDGPDSDHVRRFFIDNALYWITEFRVDALRLDAIHGIFDSSARPFLRELAQAVHREAARLGRSVWVMAESDRNDVRFISPVEEGGCGLDAQWDDDFHHSLHTLLTGERQGYYRDFGRLGHLAKAFREGFVYSGEYSRYRRRRHGNSSAGRPASQFVVFSQNHDQVGNRAAGDRLCRSQPFEKVKLAAGSVILSPYVPLLFMGEEYGEEAPFPFFVDFSDPALISAVRRGRRADLAALGWTQEFPDPEAESTFLRAKISPGRHRRGRHRTSFEFYRTLLALRKERPALRELSRKAADVVELGDKALLVRRRAPGDDVICLFCFSERPFSTILKVDGGVWRKVFDSSARRWGGPGGVAPLFLKPAPAGPAVRLQPFSFVVYAGSSGRTSPARPDNKGGARVT
jgi:maltooligosyltrehalose trehalohydrolase